MSQPGQMAPHKGPYLPSTAGLGGLPSKTLDIPVCSIFLVLFMIGAAAHMTILQINRRQEKKFLMSGMLFGFCMARIVACTMRMVWATHHTNISIAIAAQIFVAAGVLLLFIVNLIFAQRIIRASFPHWAWSKWFSWIFTAYYISIILMLAALITSVVQSFFTLNHNIRRIDHDILLVGTTYFAVAGFLPLLLLLLKATLRHKQTSVEKFGEGRFRTKIVVLVFSSLILTFGAAFRCGIGYVPRPANHPAWYHSKACFYIFNFTIEIIVVYLYVFIRVDRRFIIPNGSSGPGDYRSEIHPATKNKTHAVDRVLSEEQVFDDENENQGIQNGNGNGSGQVEGKRGDLEAAARSGTK